MSQYPSTKEWFAWIPCPPGLDEKRFMIREEHIKSAMALKNKKVLCWGGGVLEKQTEPGDTSGMTITLMTIYADTEDEARKIISEDVYAKNGIWDLENTKMYAWRTTIREPL